jgi:GATA-binding protein
MVDPNGSEHAAAQAAEAMRRSKANGTDGVDSPISRTGTPSMYNTSLSSFMVDDAYNSVAGFNGDGSGGSPMNGDRSNDTPQTQEQLIAHNSSLKTRVSELEVINELFRGRLSQLEQQEAAARRGQEVAGAEQTQLRSQLEAAQESEATLLAQLDDSHRRENILKRRLDELEAAQEALGSYNAQPASKKARLEEAPTQDSQPGETEVADDAVAAEAEAEA